MLATLVRASFRVLTALAVVYAFVAEGRRVGVIALIAWLFTLLVAVVWLPRAAHRAFRRGSYKYSIFLYKILRLWVLGEKSRRSIDVSLAACALALEDWDGALDRLDRIEPDRLTDAARAAWLNNYAYALARGERDPQAALDYADQAIALRPDVSGFRHTRGVALLALGRVDEAIADLDRLWGQLADRSGPEDALLECERCYDLGRAWQQKGETDYAIDYFQRANRASPRSRWAQRATEHLEPRTGQVIEQLLD